MFFDCSVFNSDISNWDVSKLNIAITLFRDCPVFNIDLSSWNVSNITDIAQMFAGCSAFNQDLSSWSFTVPQPMHYDWCTDAPICDDELKWPPQIRTEHTSPTRISKIQ